MACASGVALQGRVPAFPEGINEDQPRFQRSIQVGHKSTNCQETRHPGEPRWTIPCQLHVLGSEGRAGSPRQVAEGSQRLQRAQGPLKCPKVETEAVSKAECQVLWIAGWREAVSKHRWSGIRIQRSDRAADCSSRDAVYVQGET